MLPAVKRIENARLCRRHVGMFSLLFARQARQLLLLETYQRLRSSPIWLGNCGG